MTLRRLSDALTSTSDVSGRLIRISPNRNPRVSEKWDETSETSETSHPLPDLDEPRICTRCMDDFADLGFTLCTPCALEGAPE